MSPTSPNFSKRGSKSWVKTRWEQDTLGKCWELLKANAYHLPRWQQSRGGFQPSERSSDPRQLADAWKPSSVHLLRLWNNTSVINVANKGVHGIGMTKGRCIDLSLQPPWDLKALIKKSLFLLHMFRFTQGVPLWWAWHKRSHTTKNDRISKDRLLSLSGMEYIDNSHI